MNHNTEYPIISIVTPSYNQGQFITDTIESVINQEGDFYIDYIIMDGASTDNSVDVIRKYADVVTSKPLAKEIDGVVFHLYGGCKGVSYRWVSERDGGVVIAIRAGINRIIGDYFLWLNSDDRYTTKSSLDILLDAFYKCPGLDIVTADGYFIDKYGNTTGNHWVKEVNILECMFLDYHILQPSTMIRKDLLNSFSLSTRFSCVFDCEFFIKLFQNFKWKKIDEFIADYRFWGGNITDSMHSRRLREHISLAYSYSKRLDYQFLSSFYLFNSIILRPQFTKYKIYEKFFRRMRHFSYVYITGKGYRQ